ncbi:MAG TPA: hypothetical protein VHG91_03305 [Longimicrobium sp.]|nr:hypothetical protein [Longimicrobium sp.]
MATIDITREDALIVGDALKSYLDELQSEISGTDDHDFRVALQQRRERLVDFVRRLEALG